MSHLAHPTTSFRSQVKAHRLTWLAALMALAATAAVVLVLALDDGTTTTASVSPGSQPALRAGGGPSESHTAASVAGAPAGPDEAATAAAVSAH
jgi:predicted metal-binding membrane protein